MTTLPFTLADEDQTRALARRLAHGLAPGDLLILEGPLGAGKTLLAGALVHALGVPEDDPVASPTFALVHEYEGRLPVLHADLYRLGSPEEVSELGFEERREQGAVAIVEWGVRFEEELRPDAVLTLAITGELSRSATLSAHSARGAALLAELDTFAVPPSLLDR
ncbi:MAG: tRNA (adenosine(37)-N6)-threonylcarbamoyltransferase complex ATPase subunit type 1 TsaE [Sandaracinaceae bacterium]|jgi:tRNA threonylcarbamoyladenosine biosynthesis protein TsaE|nr:tRNA (adenosine(37)-N6)-threonylcarbamoyltransferase complex ATPase subunit type 1 TsaE [Sandaracinaceae bacterium]MBK7153993.1 tRNA (adenosine(37)-N6)-threonylcarbamoyltransferase complex ATPase subunit type 1 TsaE [Sandaracinaceae bacterium]MBK7776462.1 tRNA (adenosine(37)-N6)-threonylcarbamoyltransferase complex ATPase subunit type 1 TsaE [Sandaracinaceae bacterium]MBK8590870.1 tRNA (adenosine(37)-N6)-threonylcarbamoyltransferase complex ATPase subunit type 1 TsaE [Sandaracinaceae bacteriu